MNKNISRLDYLAGQALQGLLASSSHLRLSPSILVTEAAALAERLLSRIDNIPASEAEQPNHEMD